MSDTPLYVYGLQVTNYGKVRALIIPAHGRSVVIKGKNTLGKTTTINAIWEILKRDSRNRPVIITEGEDKCVLSMELCDDAGQVQFILERHVTKASERLVISAGDGSKIANTKGLIDSFLDGFSINPIKFQEEREQDQIDAILAVCSIEPPVVQVKALTGENHPVKAGESANTYLARLSADDDGVYFRRRLEAGREVTKYRGFVDKQINVVNEAREALPTGVRPAEEIAKDQAKANQDREEFTKVWNASKAAEKAHNEALRRHETLIAKHADLIEQKTQLQKQLAAIEERLDEVAIEAGNSEFDLKESQVAEREMIACLEAAKTQFPLYHIDTQKKLAEEMNAALACTKAINAAEQAEKLLDEHRAELERASERHLNLEKNLNDLRALRREILQGIDIGVPSLSIADGRLLYNGLPFIQGSDYERLWVSCAVAMRRKSRLKVLRVDGFEKLDEDNRARLLQFTHEAGWQVFASEVSSEKELKVEIQEEIES